MNIGAWTLSSESDERQTARAKPDAPSRNGASACGRDMAHRDLSHRHGHENAQSVFLHNDSQGVIVQFMYLTPSEQNAPLLPIATGLPIILSGEQVCTMAGRPLPLPKPGELT